MSDTAPVSSYPDLDADERTTLIQFLDLYRRRVIERFSALSDGQAREASLAATTLTPGGVVKHLAHMEDHWFTARIDSRELPEPWASAPFDARPDWDFESAVDDTVEQVTALYQESCERSRAVVASISSLEAKASDPSFGRGRVTLRWALVHMLEETACHVGHLELLTDSFLNKEEA
ncbi:DinB family protein [Humibacter ginsengiterrae]